MIDFLESTTVDFLLVLVRIASYMFVMPVFSMKQIPNTVKLGMIILMTFFTTGILPEYSFEVNNMLEFGMLIFQEAVLGIMLGYTSTMIFAAVQGAGDLIDSFAGLKMASNFDPITGTNSSVYSSLYNWFAVLLFFFMDGHHYLFKGITRSFALFELGNQYLDLLQLDVIIYLITRTFLISVQLALPLGIILFLVDVILGMISKAIPQMNVFLLGMSIKLLVSFGIHIFIIAGILQSISWALDNVVTVLDNFIQSLL